jgi:hypothetical protein
MKEILYYIFIDVGKKNVTKNITHTYTMLKGYFRDTLSVKYK